MRRGQPVRTRGPPPAAEQHAAVVAAGAAAGRGGARWAGGQQQVVWTRCGAGLACWRACRAVRTPLVGARCCVPAGLLPLGNTFNVAPRDARAERSADNTPSMRASTPRLV